MIYKLACQDTHSQLIANSFFFFLLCFVLASPHTQPWQWHTTCNLVKMPHFQSPFPLLFLITCQDHYCLSLFLQIHSLLGHTDVFHSKGQDREYFLNDISYYWHHKLGMDSWAVLEAIIKNGKDLINLVPWVTPLLHQKKKSKLHSIVKYKLILLTVIIILQFFCFFLSTSKHKLIIETKNILCTFWRNEECLAGWAIVLNAQDPVFNSVAQQNYEFSKRLEENGLSGKQWQT